MASDKLRDFAEGIHRIVDVPMAFEPGDPDKSRVKEIQTLAALLVRTDLSADKGRALQMFEQLKLLIDGIEGVGTRVSMKPADRLVGQALARLRAG